MIVFPNCKINLGLYILQKRTDGFHDLETIFCPVGLLDALEIIQNPAPQLIEVEFTTSGLKIDTEENICVKAYQLLKKDFPELACIKMHLHKVIPLGAGLGGGSSDGASALLLLNKKFNLGLSERQLIGYALNLGSDCPFFIKNKPCYATGRGEVLEEINLDLINYKIVLVNPKIHINTAFAFSKIKPDNTRASLKQIIQQPVSEWKNILKNDFEETVFNKYPEIKTIKHQLYQQGAVYCSMSGSGSTVYGLFEKSSQPQLSFPKGYFVKAT